MRVTDLEKSRRFYKEILELREFPEKCFDSEGSCFWINFGRNIELLPIRNNSEKAGIDEIGFWAPRLDSLRKALVASGFEPSEIRTGQAQQRFFEVRDPEGHLVLFFSPTEGGSYVFSPISHHLIHTGFIVRNRAAEDMFYKDILGLHLYWQGGMKDSDTDWVDMQLPPPSNGWVEYMLNVRPDADHHTLGVMNHIALGVPDIHAAQQQLIKNGWTGSEQPKLGRDGKWQLNLYDPDDTRIEFMEFTPKGKTCCSEFTGSHPGPKQ